MRFIGLDVHRDLCEVAIAEDGDLRSAGSVRTCPAELERFAQSLDRSDEVALEATGVATAIARVLEPHVARVIVVRAQDVGGDARRAKTDRLDARELARLLALGYLRPVWVPDEATRALRRRCSRRSGLVRQRTRQKNEVHGVLMRNLKGKPPMTDVFGKRGRAWLARLELPDDERDTIEGCLRQIAFLDDEIATLDRGIARQALDSDDIRRLMTIPGVDVQTAATLIAVIGDIRRFDSSRKLVGYLGLDPKVRQSGSDPAYHGRISKQGPAAAREALGEAAWVVLRTPGPLRAFGERIRARRGAQIAVTATARKLAVLCWHLLTKQEDYAYKRPALTQRKLRRLELTAGTATKKPAVNRRTDERELAEQAEATYKRLTANWRAKPKKKGRGPAPRRANSSHPHRETATRQDNASNPAL